MLNALVLSGGVALGSFEAGICAALEAGGGPRPDWVAGASAGAVNAAIFAGNPPEQRAARLRQFWEGMAEDPLPGFSLFFGAPMADGPLRRAHNRAAALQSLLFGRPGLFMPRFLPEAIMGRAPSLYDLTPLRRRLPELVDFDRLNAGPLRVTLVATDVTSGKRVVFDTARGTRIGPEHVVASCALLPLFAPVEVEGRLLGDGGLASNAPVDLVLEEEQEVLCILAELFAAAGAPPGNLSGSLARAGDLALGNQTQRLLEGHARLLRLRDSLHRLAALVPEERRTEPEVAALLAEAGPPARAIVLRIGYRAPPDEAGAGKLFDFSRATTADRWQAGEEALRRGLRKLAEAPAPGPGLVLHDIET
ncbi:patatin-like phospholipase family protein [Pseudoroseomonas wenyumeiae]|uniref:Patatin-like phospholipase family protein n=1 Tax=Teichococcus wenyumeiae TaxID=2478470 RepID=A0A3A9K061_9PROT|nr:patatin-like phospholipase family protein [Pseudoroseomonas wenyumeiae]RKK04739.1 patatin-like phospholipase family protein [Pseudoroseomonas wenyumeiae]RMI26954.1 patatin-like phospholipase family protein [Pseudoroseomonas wenyumeiae]